MHRSKRGTPIISLYHKMGKITSQNFLTTSSHQKKLGQQPVIRKNAIVVLLFLIFVLLLSLFPLGELFLSKVTVADKTQSSHQRCSMLTENL